MREKYFLIFMGFLFRFFRFFHNIQKEQYILSKILILQEKWQSLALLMSMSVQNFFMMLNPQSVFTSRDLELTLQYCILATYPA